MKILAVYFSRNGHTGRMAREIARRCGADVRVFATLEQLCGKPPAATFSVARKSLPLVAHREGLTDFMKEIGSL